MGAKKSGIQAANKGAFCGTATAASLLGVSQKTVRAMVKDGRLRAKRSRTGRFVLRIQEAAGYWQSLPDVDAAHKGD